MRGSRSLDAHGHRHGMFCPTRIQQSRGNGEKSLVFPGLSSPAAPRTGAGGKINVDPGRGIRARLRAAGRFRALKSKGRAGSSHEGRKIPGSGDHVKQCVVISVLCFRGGERTVKSPVRANYCKFLFNKTRPKKSSLNGKIHLRLS